MPMSVSTPSFAPVSQGRVFFVHGLGDVLGGHLALRHDFVNGLNEFGHIVLVRVRVVSCGCRTVSLRSTVVSQPQTPTRTPMPLVPADPARPVRTAGEVLARREKCNTNW